MLPDPMELEPPDSPEEHKPYWLRETTGYRRLVLHDADGTVLGWVRKCLGCRSGTPCEYFDAYDDKGHIILEIQAGGEPAVAHDLERRLISVVRAPEDSTCPL